MLGQCLLFWGQYRNFNAKSKAGICDRSTRLVITLKAWWGELIDLRYLRELEVFKQR